MIFEINKEGWEKLKAFIKTLKDTSKYYIQIISKEQKRSLEQNHWYWGYVIEAIRYFSKDEFRQYTPDDMHDHIKLTLSAYVEEYEGTLCEIELYDGRKVLKTKLSTKFEKMSQKQYNAYLQHLLDYIGIYINFPIGDLNELVRLYCEDMGKEYKPKP